MLEYVCIIISTFLFVYSIRTLIFLHSAWSHNLESGMTAQRLPMISSLALENNKVSTTVTYNENISPHDYPAYPANQLSELSNHYNIINNESGKKFNYLELNSPRFSNHGPVVSLIVATNNEEEVIDRLLKSVEMITYNQEKFEVIVVDDSTDSTARILELWTKKMKNLSIIRRKERIGSKGGALNFALQSLREDSTWVIVIDADTILPSDIIEQFLSCVNESQDKFQAIQGYCIPYNSCANSNSRSVNWVSRGIELRLAQRNMIEFVAKNKLSLPIQITGNLFMIKTAILKQVGLSADVCEDWDLTLDLYLRENNSVQCDTNVLFDETINARNQVPISFGSYFNQRLRVSEGHTRGFIKKIPTLIARKQSLKNKVELFFTGCRYLRYLLLASVLILDFVGLLIVGSKQLNIYFMLALAIQFLWIAVSLFVKVSGLAICRRTGHYTVKFLISQLVIEFCVSPALILGSLLAIFRNKTSFHRTQRFSINA